MKKDFIVDFIGIGVAKSGTTWVANMLSAHPDVCLSVPKQVNYFNYYAHFLDRFLRKGRNESLLNRNYCKPLSWYMKHFQHCKNNCIKGEFSTSYFYDEKAPVNIKNHFPDVKLIVCLRNPIDRLYSRYLMFKNYFKVEKRTFENAIKEEPMYIKDGYYSEQLATYLKYFDEDKINIIIFDDIKNKPEEVLNKLYQFIGVDHSVIPDKLNEKSNSAKEAKLKIFSEIMDYIPRFLMQVRLGFILNILKRLKINQLLMKICQREIAYPEMHPETRNLLRKVFSGDIRKLEKILNKSLAHWV